MTGRSREDLNSVYFDSLRFDLCFDSRVVYTSCDLLVFVPVWKCWCFQLLDCRGVKRFGNLSMSRLLAFKVHTLVWTKYNHFYLSYFSQHQMLTFKHTNFHNGSFLHSFHILKRVVLELKGLGMVSFLIIIIIIIIIVLFYCLLFVILE